MPASWHVSTTLVTEIAKFCISITFYLTLPVEKRSHRELRRKDALLFAAPAFDRCVACSEKVVAAFLKPDGRDEFLRRAFDDPAYLENATGLAAMKEEVDDAAWLGEDSDGDDF